jgi:FMN-dependent NADH-azoreductase
MTNVLLVSSSASGEGSTSRRIGCQVIAAIRREHPTIEVVDRDLRGIPHPDLDFLNALRLPPADRTPQQATAVGFADSLIEELERASIAVLTVPMYSFSIPSTLKAWIDYLNRSGRTYRRTSEGVEGLLVGKRICVVVTRGVSFKENDPANFQEPYLKTVLGYFGMLAVDFICAQDTARAGGPAQIEQATARAETLGAEIGRELARGSSGPRGAAP